MQASPLLTGTEAKRVVDSLKAQGKTVVFTNGCFDILHPGHVTYLSQAKALGDVLVIGLNSDASVRRLKGPSRPIMPEADRAFMLLALKAVDYVVIFDEATPMELISQLRPSIHVKGGDYQVDDLPETKIVKSYGGEVKILGFVEGQSTTDIIGRILGVG